MGDMMSGMQEALEGRDWEWNGSKQITRMHEILKYTCVCACMNTHMYFRTLHIHSHRLKT